MSKVNLEGSFPMIEYEEACTARDVFAFVNAVSNSEDLSEFFEKRKEHLTSHTKKIDEKITRHTGFTKDDPRFDMVLFNVMTCGPGNDITELW